MRKARIRNDTNKVFINLRVERIRYDITTTEFAKVAGISRNWLWRIESADNKPNSRLVEFCEYYFGKPKEYLFAISTKGEIKHDEKYCKACGRAYSEIPRLPFEN